MRSKNALGRVRPWTGVVAIVTLVGALGACESGSSSGAEESAAGSADIAVAEEIVSAAESGSVSGPAAGPIKAAQVKPATAESVKAFPFKPGGPEKSVVVVGCSPAASTCVHEAALITDTFEVLGVKARTITARDFSPAAAQSAWNDAIGSQPDAIIGVATPGSSIGAQLATAKEQGIFTMYVNGTEKSGRGFDAYVPGAWSLGQVALASKMIVGGGGNTNVSWLNVPLFPDLGVPEGIAFFEENCPDCKVNPGKYTSEQVLDPVKIQQLTTSTIVANQGIDYLALASADAQVNAAAQAIRTSSTPDVKLAGVGLTGEAQSSLARGDFPFIVGAPQQWIALQAVDGALRGMAGEPAVAPEDLKMGVYIMTKENAPKNPDYTTARIDRWAVEQFDFVTPYAEAWNVDLSTVAGK